MGSILTTTSTMATTNSETTTTTSSQPKDCRSGRKVCSNVGSLDPERLGYCRNCFAYIQSNVAIPWDEFQTALTTTANADNDTKEPQALDGTVYSTAMVWSSKLPCEKCKTVLPAGSLVIGTPGTKTVSRAYDPGTYVWKGPVSITKMRCPNCIPTTKRFLQQLQQADGDISVFRGAHRLPPTLQSQLQTWMQTVTSDEGNAAVEAEVQRKVIELTERFPIYGHMA